MPVTETKLKKKIDLKNNITCPTLASGKQNRSSLSIRHLRGKLGRVFFAKTSGTVTRDRDKY